MPVAESRIQISRLLPVIVFVALAVFFAVALRSGDPSRLPSTLIGKPVPQSTFPAIEGAEWEGRPIAGFSSGDLAKGKVSIVNFWASWCAPCVEEHPYLLELRKSANVDIYGVNYKDEPASARHFLSRYGNPFTALGSDSNGRLAIDWGVYGMPETFIVNGKGEVVLKHVGPITSDAITGELLPAIEKARGSAAQR